MEPLLIRLLTKAELWLQRTTEVARFDGIILADFRDLKNRTPHFRDIILAALGLLKATDPYRFARVQRRLNWITLRTLTRRGSAEYYHHTRTCAIDFLEPSAKWDVEYLTGWYACTLVHEATHGEIRSRGIHYTPQLRSRIEHRCVKEEQKFVTRLAITNPELAERIYQEFDASRWESYWNATPREQLRAQMRFIFFPNKRA